MYFTTLSYPAAFAVLLALIPINHYVNKKQRKLQGANSKTKDARIKFLTEILNGIQTIKIHAWEKPFMEQIEAFRRAEQKTQRKMGSLAIPGREKVTNYQLMM